MVDVKLDRLNTLTVAVGETYRLRWGSNGALDIWNNTEGSLVVSDSPVVVEAKSIFIEAGCGYADLSCGSEIYLNPTASGKVQIVVIRGL